MGLFEQIERKRSGREKEQVECRAFLDQMGSFFEEEEELRERLSETLSCEEAENKASEIVMTTSEAEFEGQEEEEIRQSFYGNDNGIEMPDEFQVMQETIDMGSLDPISDLTQQVSPKVMSVRSTGEEIVGIQRSVVQEAQEEECKRRLSNLEDDASFQLLEEEEQIEACHSPVDPSSDEMHLFDVGVGEEEEEEMETRSVAVAHSFQFAIGLSFEIADGIMSQALKDILS